MEGGEVMVLNEKLNQIKLNIVTLYTKNKAETFFTQNMHKSLDKETLYTLCLPSFMKNVEDRDRNDHILISIFLYQNKKFINLFKNNMMNVNEKLDSKFYDSLHFISSNIAYTKFNGNRLLMRYGEEGKKFYLLLKGDVSILIPIKKIVNISINEFKRYIALLIIYKEYKILTDVLKENKSVFNIGLNFTEGSHNYNKFIDLFQSIKLFNRDEEDIEELEKNRNKEIVTQLLDLYLTSDEKKFYNKYVVTKKGKYHEEVDDGIFLSSREYINRMIKYSNFDFNTVTREISNIEEEKRFKKRKEDSKINKPQMDDIDLNEIKVFLIYEYHRVTELTSGEMFGDRALSSANSQRTATIITLSECHFGFLYDAIYNQTIKEYNDKNRRNRIIYLCNIQIMNSFSYKLMEKRYYNKFVFKGAKKDELIIRQNDQNPNIILFKEGVFEISFKGTINDIDDIIIFYMKQYDSIVKRGSDINEDILNNVITLNRQRKKISNLFPRQINNEYEFKLFLVNAPSIFGMVQTEKDEKFFEMRKEKNFEKNTFYSFYTIKCHSKLCEYVLLNKRLFEEEIMKDDKSLKDRKNLFLKEFFEKIIQRLLIIGYGKIWNLLLESGICTKNSRENIDWNKIELNHDFIKGMNKLIDEINEHKFSNTDIDKGIDKYYEEKRIKRIVEKQQLKKVNNQYSVNKILNLLNSKNINEISSHKKGDTPKNIKYSNSSTLRKESLIKRKMSTKRNSFIIKNRNNSGIINNRFSADSLQRNKNIKKLRKRLWFFADDKTQINKSSKINLPNVSNSFNKHGQKKLNSSDKVENTKSSLLIPEVKKVPKRRISFFSPNINPYNREMNLKMHLCLYDTFKKFGESHTKDVIKKTKMVELIEYEKNEINSDDN